MQTQTDTVFISYTHDSVEHCQEVRKLADRLRAGGVNANIDQYVFGSPEEGWPLWMERSVRQARSVLVVCTERYLARAIGQEKPSKGLGGKWESFIAHQLMYNSDSKNPNRFIPVVLSEKDVQFIPIPLQSASHYNISESGSYESLYAILTGQHVAAPPPLGPIRPIADIPSLTSRASGDTGASILPSTGSSATDEYLREIAFSVIAGESRASTSKEESDKALEPQDETESRTIAADRLFELLVELRVDSARGAKRAISGILNHQFDPLINYLELRLRRTDPTTSNTVQRLALLRQLADASNRNGDFDRRYKYLQEIVTLDSTDFSSHIALAEIELRIGRLDVAEVLGGHALTLAQPMSSGYARSLDLLGDIEYERGSLDKAEAYYIRVLDYACRSGRRFIMLNAYTSLGMTAMRLGEEMVAIDMMTNAVDVAEGIEDPFSRVRAIINRGVVFLGLSKIEEAARDLIEAELIQKRSNSGFLRRSSLAVNLGLLAWAQGDKARAVGYLKQGRSYYSMSHQNIRVARIDRWLKEIEMGVASFDPRSIY